jgi:pyruvate ferredoxin oxidoreductase gamma subunit
VFQVRFHGRGGQGVVTAAELLSVAAFAEGRHAQAFPSFGSERTGAPVVSFCRISDLAVRTREPVIRPDAVVVQDLTLVHQVDLFQGLGPDGYVLLNSSRPLAELGLHELEDLLVPGRARTVAATELALAHTGRPLPNVALLGALAGLTGVVSLDAVLAAVGQRFEGAMASGNADAASAAFRLVQPVHKELTGAPPA